MCPFNGHAWLAATTLLIWIFWCMHVNMLMKLTRVAQEFYCMFYCSCANPLTIRLVQEDHKHVKVTAAFVNNVSKLGKPKLNRVSSTRAWTSLALYILFCRLRVICLHSSFISHDHFTCYNNCQQQESRAVAWKPRDANVNFDRYGVCRQLFVFSRPY